MSKYRNRAVLSGVLYDEIKSSQLLPLTLARSEYEQVELPGERGSGRKAVRHKR
jgi:hypothetical protein